MSIYISSGKVSSGLLVSNNIAYVTGDGVDDILIMDTSAEFVSAWAIHNGVKIDTISLA